MPSGWLGKAYYTHALIYYNFDLFIFSLNCPCEHPFTNKINITESFRYVDIAAVENAQKGIKLCRKHGIFKLWGIVHCLPSYIILQKCMQATQETCFTKAYTASKLQDI